MSNDIYLIGEVGWDINLQSVIGQVEKTDKSQPLNVHIHSQGGSVYDGLAIYNYLKGLEQDVNTISSGLVASIASIIFLAGNKETRKINSTDSFLIHLPMGGMEGNAIDFEKTAKELRNIEDKLADIYVNETNLTKEEALALMTKDEMLNVSLLKDKGFVSEITEFKAVAKFNINKNEMSENLTEEKVEGLLDKFFNKFFPKSEPTNKIVQDANGEEIDFANVEEDASPKVGDEATIGGEKANGNYVMPSGETFVFTDGSLSEIIEAAAEETNEELEAAKKRVEELEAQLTEKETVVATLTETNETLTNSYEGIKNEFTELKNEITSGFTPQAKKEAKKEDGEKTRKLFKD